MQQPEQPSPRGDKSLSDQVGEMAEQIRKEGQSQEEEQSKKEEQRQEEEESQKEEHTQPEGTATQEGERQGTVLRERREDELPNPKKRMWEEPIDRSGGKDPRDEL